MVSQATVTVGEDETAVTAIVTALCELEDAASDELHPLGAVVDPTLINSFVDEGQDETIDGQIEFPYGDYLITVEADGTISVSAAPSQRDV